jgi:cation diffusion facilitator CzcD-associated flavoprotein CzcO
MSVPHSQIAIIGSGLGGLGAAIKLLRAGFSDFVVLERGNDIGGTWRDNTYPGCACDVESHLYSFSFAPNPNWSRKFAPQDEIWAYLRECATRFGIHPYLRLNCELLSGRWDGARWQLETSDGPRTADVVISAAGPLSEPNIPDLPGLSAFAGTVFHSARWDHDHDLTGERVAIVGTGASAIQFLPHVQKVADRVISFQRTAPWVVPRHDEPIPVKRQRLFRRLPLAQRLIRAQIYLVREIVVGRALLGNARMHRFLRTMALRHLVRKVSDRDLRAKLTPKYEYGCKRILVSDDYYPAVTQPNVSVNTEGIADIRERSVVDGSGVEHPVDTIIFGTGFHVTDMPIGDRLSDVDGVTLAEHWKGTPQTYLGTTVTGFPNLFFVIGPNTGLGHNSMIYMIECHLDYIVGCLRRMRRRGIASVEVRAEVQAEFNAELQRRMSTTVWTTGGCTSWYLTPEGRNTTLWPGLTWRFRRATRRFDPAAYVERSVGMTAY